MGLGHSGLSAVTQRSQGCGDSCLGLEEVGRVADRWSSALLGWGSAGHEVEREPLEASGQAGGSVGAELAVWFWGFFPC